MRERLDCLADMERRRLRLLNDVMAEALRSAGEDASKWKIVPHVATTPRLSGTVGKSWCDWF